MIRSLAGDTTKNNSLVDSLPSLMFERTINDGFHGLSIPAALIRGVQKPEHTNNGLVNGIRTQMRTSSIGM